MTEFDKLEVGYDIPARPGMPINDVQTPALVIDMEAFEHNLSKMQGHADALGVKLRAHAKTHKSADIALAQMAAGAVGVCCQKVSEADALVRAGVSDILISNEVRGLAKVERLVSLAKRAKISVCVDDFANLEELSEVVAGSGVTLDCLVEIDVGARRCGVAPGEDAVELAKAIAATPNLRFAGLQAYNGSAQHIRAHSERHDAAANTIEQTAMTVDMLRDAGIDCLTVSGAGTGTFPFEGASGVYTELQCGSYCFMDADYDRVVGSGTGGIGEFRNALFILTSVMSKTKRDRAVCDAGLKVMSLESGLPRVFGMEGVEYFNASDEHGELSDPSGKLMVHDKVQLVPGHCDPTCNLHDWYVCVRNGTVENLWPVTARGKVW